MQKIETFEELNSYFQDSDHVDVKTIDGKAELRPFIAGMLSYYPAWMILLYRLREVLVIILGLAKHAKPESLPSITPDQLAFEPGENAAFFVVRRAKEDRYWVAETPQDRHLKAYFGVTAEKLSNGLTRFHVFTAVKYTHWTGPLYFNLIRPFHHLVVSSMMRAGIRR